MAYEVFFFNHSLISNKHSIYLGDFQFVVVVVVVISIHINNAKNVRMNGIGIIDVSDQPIFQPCSIWRGNKLVFSLSFFALLNE